MNFGHKIAVVFTLFVIFIVSLVVFTVKQKDIFLVSEDYYKKEIAYQDEINKFENANELSVPVKITTAEGKVSIAFPEELQDIKGEVYFYRPSNAGLDFKIPIKVNEANTQDVSTTDLVQGRWVVKLEWMSEGAHYQKEEKIRI